MTATKIHVGRIDERIIQRVLREGIVDTKTYRYFLDQRIGQTRIIRLPIKWLNTTAAIDGWEIYCIVC